MFINCRSEGPHRSPLCLSWQVEGSRYLVLEDLCHAVGSTHPSILDIKMGRVTSGVHATPDKVEPLEHCMP